MLREMANTLPEKEEGELDNKQLQSSFVIYLNLK